MTKFSGTIVALALLAGCSSVKVVKKQGVDMPPVQFALRSLTYPSGLRVLVERDDRTKLAGVFVVVGAGSTSDPVGKEGLAHYVEHLTFRSRPDGGRNFRALLGDSGAFLLNAVTHFESTVYFELGPASELPAILRLEGARMENPVAHLSDAVLAAELDVVKNELREKDETGFPGDVMAEMLAAVFPKDHPYARPPIGTLGTIGALRASDVDAFVADHYRPKNMTMVIIGDLALETADRLVADNLPPYLLEAPTRVAIPPRMPPVPPPAPAAPASTAQLERKTARVSAPQIWIGWSLPRSFDTDQYLLAFVREAAQQRLSRVASNDKDIARVSVAILPGVQASLLVCRVVLHQNAHPEQTRDRILDELPRIWTSRNQRAEDRAEDAFSIERRFVAVAEISAAQSLVTRGMKRAIISHFSQDPTVYSRALRELSGIRREALAVFASPWLTKERARSVLFVPRAGSLAMTAAPGGDGAPTAESDIDAPPISIEPPESVDATKVAGRLRRLFIEGETSTSRLPNGLTVIVQRRAGLPIVSAGLLLPAVRHGRKESAAAEVAWIVARPEHVLNQPMAFYGAGTLKIRSPDSVAYIVEAASGNAEALLATFAEYTQSMGISRWDSIRKSVVPSWKRSEQDTRTVATRKLLASLLRGTGYSFDLTADDLEHSSEDDVRDWIQRTHSPANATLAVVGDLDPKQVEKWVAESFGPWSASSREEAPPKSAVVVVARMPAPLDEKVLVTNRSDATQTHLEFACLLPRGDDSAAAERYAVAAAILQERLWKVAREELGATYAPYVQASVRRGGIAYLEVSSLVEPGKLVPVLGAVKRTLASIAAQPASADELAAAKMKIAGLHAAAQMSNLGIVWRHLTNARMGHAIAERDPTAELAAVSAEDVRAGFQSCLSENATLSLVGDEKNVRAAVEAGWR
ncbi:MAG: M16 family metallopeptidase [Myxococcales bacterium]